MHREYRILGRVSIVLSLGSRGSESEENETFLQ